MKKLAIIFILSIIMVLSLRCASAPIVKEPEIKKEPAYTIIVEPCRGSDGVHKDVTVKLPEGTPDISKSRGYKRRLSEGILALETRTPDGAYYCLLAMTQECRILGFILREKGVGNTEYYIYPVAEGDPVRVESWKQVKLFLANYAPEWQSTEE